MNMTGIETRREAGSLSVAEAERLAEIMQALASPVRLRILSALSVQPSTVTDLSEHLRIGQTTTSNHLRLLRHLSLVIGTRTARGGHRAPRAPARRRMTPPETPDSEGLLLAFARAGDAAIGGSASLLVGKRSIPVRCCQRCDRAPET